MCCQGHQNQVREPNPEGDQSALHLIGYHTSRKELRDVYHSVHLLNRALGPPPVGRSNGKEQSGRSLCFRKGYEGGHPLPMPKVPLRTKWVQPLCKRMRQPCSKFAVKSWKPLQVCRMIWTDLTTK